MSQVFEGYERQNCELSAVLAKIITSASVVDGEQKKQKLSEVKGGLEDAEALIRKMDIEAKSLPPNVKATRLAKLREYITDLNNLKAEVKRITSANSNLAVRDDLLESGMADKLMLHGVDDNISRSKKVLTNMSRRMSRNKWIMSFIITILVITTILNLYFKLTC